MEAGTAPKIGVLSLQGAVSEHARQLQKCGAEPVRVKKPHEMQEVEGLIIPGGESTTIGFLLEENGLMEAIKEKGRGGMPLWGTCAGMVLLARRLEDGSLQQPLLKLMNITVKRNAFGRQKDSFETLLKIKGIEQPVRGAFIRAPMVTGTGEGVDILGEVEEGIVAVRKDNLLAASFHPELTGDFSMHSYFLQMCRE